MGLLGTTWGVDWGLLGASWGLDWGLRGMEVLGRGRAVTGCLKSWPLFWVGCSGCFCCGILPEGEVFETLPRALKVKKIS